MDAASLVIELLQENDCNVSDSHCVGGKGVTVWKLRVAMETGNIMYVLIEDTIVNFQINNDPWRTYSLEDPESLDKIVEALRS